MALARTRRGDSGMNYWPGFVDALSTLILGIIFLLTVFVVVQFYLQQEVAGKDTALNRLNAQIAQLTELLSMEKSGKANLEDQLAQLRATLATAESERDNFKEQPRTPAPAPLPRRARFPNSPASSKARRNSPRARWRRSRCSTSRSRRCAASSPRSNRRSTPPRRRTRNRRPRSPISDSGSIWRWRERVKELKRYRSDFFGKLREILGNRPDVRVVGDRFVLQSEVFFDTGKADLKPEGRAELDKVAGALVELEKQIPTDIAWVLRVDGHTDVRPIAAGGVFKSNWDLSAARAISVVQYLVGKGVSPQRLVAAGFGEFQPIDSARPRTPTSATAASSSS